MAAGSPRKVTSFSAFLVPPSESGLSRLPIVRSALRSRFATRASGAAPPLLAMSTFTRRSKIMSPTAATVRVAGPEGAAFAEEVAVAAVALGGLVGGTALAGFASTGPEAAVEALVTCEAAAGAAGADEVARRDSAAETTAHPVPPSTTTSASAPRATVRVRRRRRCAAERKLRRLTVWRVGPGMRVVSLLRAGS